MLTDFQHSRNTRDTLLNVFIWEIDRISHISRESESWEFLFPVRTTHRKRQKQFVDMANQTLSRYDEQQMLLQLSAQERRISAPCLKHLPSGAATQGPQINTAEEEEPVVDEVPLEEEERGALFSETVDAVQTIVRDKLYKSKAKSLEAYFNAVWHISRAQVYRYLDCATVLDVRLIWLGKSLQKLMRNAIRPLMDSRSCQTESVSVAQ